MPGFLGTQKQFHDRYGKPILLSGNPKSTSKDQEAGNNFFFFFFQTNK